MEEGRWWRVVVDRLEDGTLDLAGKETPSGRRGCKWLAPIR